MIWIQQRWKITGGRCSPRSEHLSCSQSTWAAWWSVEPRVREDWQSRSLWKQETSCFQGEQWWSYWKLVDMNEKRFQSPVLVILEPYEWHGDCFLISDFGNRRVESNTHIIPDLVVQNSHYFLKSHLCWKISASLTLACLSSHTLSKYSKSCAVRSSSSVSGPMISPFVITATSFGFRPASADADDFFEQKMLSVDCSSLFSGTRPLSRTFSVSSIPAPACSRNLVTDPRRHALPTSSELGIKATLLLFRTAADWSASAANFWWTGFSKSATIHVFTTWSPWSEN